MPHCRSRLSYGGVGPIVLSTVGLAVVVALALEAGTSLVARVGTRGWMVMMVLFVTQFISSWSLVEWGIAAYLRAHRVLTAAIPRTAAPAPEPAKISPA